MNEEDRITDLSYMTGVVNTMGRDDDLDLWYTRHCIERQEERGITTLDIINVLKYGRVVEYIGKGSHPTNNKIHKYKITGEYLGNNTSIREISLILLIEVDRFKNPAIKIQKVITAMWEDIK